MNRLKFALLFLGGASVYGGVSTSDWRLGGIGAGLLSLLILPSLIGFGLHYRERRTR